MAEDQRRSSLYSLSSTGLLALALAVFGLIWSGPSPLIPERPGTHTATTVHKEKIQDIDARLWQDPLGAIQKDARKPSSRQRVVSLKQTGKNDLNLVIEETNVSDTIDHLPQNTIHQIFEKKEDKDKNSYLMLAVMVPGGPYPEQEEGRRRMRYAVLSAMATQDFAPRETELIGYFRTKPACDVYLPEAIPFEILEEKWEKPRWGKPRKKVVVLWLDSGRLDKKVRKSINEIFNQAEPENPDDLNIRHAVIGPNQSGHLKNLIEETIASSYQDKLTPTEKPGREAADCQSNKPVRTIEFFAAKATISPFLLDYDTQKSNKKRRYEPIDKLWRTIGNDKDISHALVEELGLRQIKPKSDHVLLISEWDTLYGRSFPNTFAEAYAGDRSKCIPLGYAKPDGAGDSKVHCVNYMKGIDGLLPGDSDKTDTAQEILNKPETIQVNSNIDRPSGNNQKDYLRRLVDQVRKLDTNLRNHNLPCPVRNNGISAIGVVGSDVYDKLMILQALRPYFRGKIFFTTDLDAAYLSPREQPYTHNLIVGSSFGLNLAPELQMSIPPFRDSYQTAVFFSTKLATSKWKANLGKAAGNSGENNLVSKLDIWLQKPRIFEIGRKGLVDLSEENPANSNNSKNCKRDIRSCNYIHPDPDIRTGTNMSSSIMILGLSSLVLGLLLLYRMSWTFRWLPGRINGWIDRLRGYDYPSDTQPQTVSTSNAHKVWSAYAAVLISMLPLIMMGLLVIGTIFFALKEIGPIYEPFYWGSGVSTWPSNILTGLSIILSVAFYYRIRHQLEASDKKLQADFCLYGRENQTEDWQFLSVHTWKYRGKNETAIDVAELWADYLGYGKRSLRFRRSAINTVIYMLFGLTAIMLSGGLPVPARGHAFYIDAFIEVGCVIAVVFLIMWIVDAACLFCKFIALLAEDRMSNWPNICDEKWGWPAQHVIHAAYWMDIQFVAQYTKSMEKFVWYPVLPLILIGAARSPVFDNWTFSAGLLVSVVILLLYLVSVAFLLQYGAKTMRAKAVSKLAENLRRLRGLTKIDDKKIAHLEKMLDEIKNNREGAFTPFLQQPMVQALLAFLSGSGGLLLLLDNFF